MILTLLVLFVITSLISLFTFEGFKKFSNLYNIIFLMFFIAMFYIAGFREPGIDRDYESYQYWFDKMRGNVEISFHYISQLIKSFGGSSIYLFVIYALIGVSTKFFVIKKMSAFPFLSLVIYLGYLFPLQDLTQIRAGAAAGIIMLAIYFFLEGRKIYSYLLIALAITFHYSSFIVIPLLFLNKKKFNTVFFLLLILVSHVAAPLLKRIIELSIDFLPAVIRWKILAYDSENNLELNIFNGWQLLRITIALFFIFNVGKLFQKDTRLVYVLKMYIIGICSFPLLSFNPVFAVRVSDLYFVSELILIPSILYLFPAKGIMKVVVILYAFSFLYLNLFYIAIFSK